MPKWNSRSTFITLKSQKAWRYCRLWSIHTPHAMHGMRIHTLMLVQTVQSHSASHCMWMTKSSCEKFRVFETIPLAHHRSSISDCHRRRRRRRRRRVCVLYFVCEWVLLACLHIIFENELLITINLGSVKCRCVFALPHTGGIVLHNFMCQYYTLTETQFVPCIHTICIDHPVVVPQKLKATSFWYNMFALSRQSISYFIGLIFLRGATHYGIHTSAISFFLRTKNNIRGHENRLNEFLGCWSKSINASRLISYIA